MVTNSPSVLSSLRRINRQQSGRAGATDKVGGCDLARHTSESPVIAVQLSRQHVVDLLRRAGLTEIAEAALHDLPDTIDREDVAAWGGKWNIDMGYIIDRIGGSP